MIRAVMFDFGGVLSHFGLAGDITRRLADTLGTDPGRISSTCGELIGDWSCGRLPSVKFWQQTARQLGRPDDVPYDTKWRDGERRSYETAYYELARELHRRGLLAGVLSNINPVSAAIIRQNGGYHGFSPVLLSCETGWLKPQSGAYRHLLSTLQLPGEAVLLVDDQPANLAAAAAYGIRTVQAYQPAATIRAIWAALDAAS